MIKEKELKRIVTEICKTYKQYQDKIVNFQDAELTGNDSFEFIFIDSDKMNLYISSLNRNCSQLDVQAFHEVVHDDVSALMDFLDTDMIKFKVCNWYISINIPSCNKQHKEYSKQFCFKSL